MISTVTSNPYFQISGTTLSKVEVIGLILNTRSQASYYTIRKIGAERSWIDI